MTYSLAQFPLQLVVFPGEKIPLHIFEPRYRDLISDCENEGVAFGITPMIEGVLQEVGTSMVLKSIKKRYPDGRLDITVLATHCYKLERFHVTSETKSYGIGLVSDLVLGGNPDVGYEQQINALMEELYTIMRIPKKKIPAKFDLHELVHKIGLSLMDEYNLLKITDAVERQLFIINRLERIVPQVRDMEEIRKRIEMNGDTRFIIPPK